MKKFRIIKFKSKPLLRAKSISKSFDGRFILRKIDINLNQGEMLGLLGSNGAGKSTFMNIVLGLLRCDFGDIFLGDVKLTNLPIHERSKLGIAYLPQQTAIFRGLTVYENLLGIAQIVIKDSTKQKDRVEKLMQDVKLRDEMRNFKSPVSGKVIMKELNLKPGREVGEIKTLIEGTLHIIIYVPYWVNNLTGLPLIFQHRSSLRHGKVVACQRTFYFVRNFS